MPRRTSIGVDFNRVNLLVAILEKVAGLHLGGMDIFMNVVAGIRINEPAVDAGIIAAIASSFREIPLNSRPALFGEVGLSGEIRAVTQAEARVKEAAKIGFQRIIMPLTDASRLKDQGDGDIIGTRNVEDFLTHLFA